MPDARALYLDLMERCLVGLIHEDAPQDPWSTGVFDAARRARGQDWPSRAHTMIGTARLGSLRQLCESVLQRGIPGDFLEAGVWRGGACILMRAVLAAHGETGRTVWCADSFRGLPKPDLQRYPQDAGDVHHSHAALAVSLEEVKQNFRRYDLLDGQVRFLEGFFEDTLAAAPIGRLAILRVDGDMYQSTIQVLEVLHDRVSPGGFVIIDDFGALRGCRQAVNDFRGARGIRDEMHAIDWTGAYWQKGAG